MNYASFLKKKKNRACVQAKQLHTFVYFTSSLGYVQQSLIMYAQTFLKAAHL